MKYKSVWYFVFGQKYGIDEVTQRSTAYETLAASDSCHGCECWIHPAETAGGRLFCVAPFTINNLNACRKVRK